MFVLTDILEYASYRRVKNYIIILLKYLIYDIYIISIIYVPFVVDTSDGKNLPPDVQTNQQNTNSFQGAKTRNSSPCQRYQPVW